MTLAPHADGSAWLAESSASEPKRVSFVEQAPNKVRTRRVAASRAEVARKNEFFRFKMEIVGSLILEEYITRLEISNCSYLVTGWCFFHDTTTLCVTGLARVIK